MMRVNKNRYLFKQIFPGQKIFNNLSVLQNNYFAARFTYRSLLHTIGIETKEEAERSGEGVYTCHHVVALAMKTLVTSVILVIR